MKVTVSSSRYVTDSKCFTGMLLRPGKIHAHKQ